MHARKRTGWMLVWVLNPTRQPERSPRPTVVTMNIGWSSRPISDWDAEASTQRRLRAVGDGLLRDLLERLVGVGEPIRVDLSARADQVLDRIGHVPHIHVHPGEHTTFAEPERDELARLEVAADHHLVGAFG